MCFFLLLLKMFKSDFVASFVILVVMGKKYCNCEFSRNATLNIAVRECEGGAALHIRQCLISYVRHFDILFKSISVSKKKTTKK